MAVKPSLSQVDLNLLVYLDLLLTQGSVTRAASKAGISQSAMSRALSRLREIFEDPLFVPSGRGVEPTPRAAALAGPLRQILSDLQTRVLTSTEFDPATAQHELTIATSDFTDALLMPHVLQHIVKQAPGITLQLVGIAKVLTELPDINVDLVMGLHRVAPPDARMRHLFEDGFACLARTDHPGVESAALTLDAFVDAPHVLVSPTGSKISDIDRMLAEKSLTRRIVARVHAYLLAPPLIAGTDRILTLPRRLAERLATQYGFQVVSAPVELGTMRFNMLWHERSQEDAAHQWLRNLVWESARLLREAP